MSAHPYLPRLRFVLNVDLAEDRPDVRAARIALRSIIADMVAEPPTPTPTVPVTPPVSPVAPSVPVVTVIDPITLDDLFRRLRDAMAPGTTYTLEIES